MALRPILEICDRDTGYKGGERRRDLWWRKTEARKQISATLEDISVAARSRCWESVRRGEGGEGMKVAESGSRSDGPRYAGMETDDAPVVR